MSIKPIETYPKLSTALSLTFLLCGVLLVLLLLSRISAHVARFERALQDELIMVAADGIAHVLNLSFEREWSSLGAVAKGVNYDDPKKIVHFVDAVKRVGGSVEWAGFVDFDGTIVAGTKRLGEGASVRFHDWFQHGLAGGGIANVNWHPDEEEAPFLQLTRPVVDEDGQVIGVVAYIMNMDWGRQLLTETAAHLGAEAVLLDFEGKVLIDTRADKSSRLPKKTFVSTNNSVKTLKLPRRGESAGELTYSSIPALASETFPYFGGQLIVMAPTKMAEATITNLTRKLFYWVVGSLTIAILVPIVLVAHFVKPIERLAKCANNLADGKFEFPEERCFTREAAILSASLARLQTRLKRLEST